MIFWYEKNVSELFVVSLYKGKNQSVVIITANKISCDHNHQLKKNITFINILEKCIIIKDVNQIQG